MTLDELNERIKAGRYASSAVICEEDGMRGRIYIVYDRVPPPAPTRILVDTVAGYRERWGL